MRKNVAELLDPRHEVVDFVGRGAELGELLAWCADGADTPVRIVIGASGAGKTRLGVELARQLRARGWRIEWPGPEQSWSHRIEPGVVAFPRKLLLIIDRADERADLAELINAVTQDRPQARLLLLATGAGSWCDQLELVELTDHSTISAARSALIELPLGLAPDLSGAEVVARAAACFAAELGQAAGSGPADSGPARVLDLHRIALVSVAGKDAEPNWQQAAVREYLVGSDFPADSPLLPRRLADALVLTALHKAAAFTTDCLDGIKADQALAAVRLLAGASADRLPTAPLPEHAIGLLAGELAELDGPVPTLTQIFNALPDQSPAWDQAGLAICQRIADQLPADAKPALRAYWLHHLGTRRWRAGHRQDSILPAEQAVALRRELAADDPDRHLASLAFSLNSLGLQRADQGQLEAAVTTMTEAATMLRASSVTSPERYLPALAATLEQLGRINEQGKDLPAAVDARTEAVTIWRELAKAAPEAYQPRLARSEAQLSVTASRPAGQPTPASRT